MKLKHVNHSPKETIRYLPYQNIWQKLHIDTPLLLSLLVLSGYGLFVLYSALGQNTNLLLSQIIHLFLAFILMIVIAQIPPIKLQAWAPWVFSLSLTLLITVLVIGKMGKGAQRWLDIGFIRFQPSEVVKIAVPMMLAWYCHRNKLPPGQKELFWCGLILLVPVMLTAKQPDLGTALLIALAGACVILLAGLSWRFILSLLLLFLASLPIIWHFMHDYQKQRVLTFINPERDPLGSGYHIIQSKIAIGSGGLLGKGWLHGTQSHLHFLPEHATDFIFAVVGEELGLIGCIILITLYLIVTARCLYLSSQAQDTFSRLLAGSLSITFFLSVFINIGMVSGILPVVGVPLPLISYGGTSMVTTCIAFGIIMSIHTHRRLLSA